MGNVLATVADRRLGVDTSSDSIIDYYRADLATANDYYLGGMQMPGRAYSSGTDYRYGFNGQEKSTEIDPNGNSMTAEFWQYDARLGRRWNTDPKPTVSISPYAAFENNGIFNSDPLGDTTRPTTYQSSWSNDADNLKYKQSGKYAEHRKKFNLGTGEEMYKVNGTYIFERDNYDNGKNDFWFYNGVGWESFTPEMPKPLPRNMLKMIFWSPLEASLSPVDDIDVYISGSIKHTSTKEFKLGMDVPGIGKLGDKLRLSGTVVYGGLQGGFTTEDNRMFYGDIITGDNSYVGVKTNGVESRFLPFRGLGATTNTPKYGDYAPQIRVLKDGPTFRKYIQTQYEFATGVNKLKITVGGRAKIESPKVAGWSAEAVVGGRFKLKLPGLIEALIK